MPEPERPRFLRRVIERGSNVFNDPAPVLNSRYRSDGVATVHLEPFQRDLRNQVEAKVRTGTYGLEFVRCAVCEARAGRSLAEKDRYGLSFRVVICSQCGLIYTNPRMSQAAYTAFYDDEYRPLYHGKSRTADELSAGQIVRGKQIAAFLEEHNINVRGLRVLEVGCGAGGTLAYLRDVFACEVDGCDFGREGIRYAAVNHALELHVGNLESIKLRWQPDLVLYSHVLEHVLELSRECSLIRRVLSGEGLVYVEAPSVKSIRKAYAWDFLRFLQNAHTYHFTLTTLSNVMRRNGFELVVGTETVRAVFRKAEPSSKYVSDYSSTMSFLRHTEHLRSVVPILSGAGRLARRVSVVLLEVVGLRSTAARVLRHLRRAQTTAHDR